MTRRAQRKAQDDASPNSHLIQAHYREFQLDKWDRKRVARLCSTLGCTVREIFSVAGIFHTARINKFWNGDKLPPEVALHFARLERFVYARIFGTALPPDPAEIQTAVLIARSLKNGRSQSSGHAGEHECPFESRSDGSAPG